MDVQWLQATFPNISGGLGLTTEKIPLEIIFSEGLTWLT